ASFAFVRVVRGMPSLRPFRPGVLRSSRTFAVALPTGPSTDPDTRAAIFDGGLPKALMQSLPWVRLIEPPGIGGSLPEFEEHGLGVTTAFLFGPLNADEIGDRPVCDVDHVRVLDDKTGSDFEYYDVLDRILRHLDKNKGVYKLVNISLGPNITIDD